MVTSHQGELRGMVSLVTASCSKQYTVKKSYSYWCTCLFFNPSSWIVTTIPSAVNTKPLNRQKGNYMTTIWEWWSSQSSLLEETVYKASHQLVGSSVKCFYCDRVNHKATKVLDSVCSNFNKTGHLAKGKQPVSKAKLPIDVIIWSRIIFCSLSKIQEPLLTTRVPYMLNGKPVKLTSTLWFSAHFSLCVQTNRFFICKTQLCFDLVSYLCSLYLDLFQTTKRHCYDGCSSIPSSVGVTDLWPNNPS